MLRSAISMPMRALALLPRHARAGLVAATLGAMALAPSAALAAVSGTVIGQQEQGYGRAALDFREIVQARTRVANGILVVDFDRSVALDLSKLTAQLSRYVSVVRLDPDGKALRLALTGQYKVNLLAAGEKLFLDLLPASWTGLPPGLPSEVVQALALRALAAEAKLKQIGGAPQREAQVLEARVIKTPAYTRIVFPVEAGVPVALRNEEGGAKLEFAAPLRFEPRTIKPDLPPNLTSIAAETEDGRLVVSLATSQGTTLRGAREDDGYMLDIVLPRITAAKPAALPLKAEPAAVEKPQPAPVAPPAAPVKAEVVQAPAPVLSSGPVQPSFERVGNSLRVALPFDRPVPAAAFQRANTAWLVFEDRQPIAPGDLPEVVRSAVSAMTFHHGAGVSVLKLTLRTAAILTLAPSGNGWIATIGDDLLAGAAAIDLQPGFNSAGRTALTARLAKAGAVFWLDDPEAGDRLAVVTALGPARGLPKNRNFVEVEALQSAHGLVFKPLADDITVSAGLDDVTVGREQGLVLSAASGRQGAPAAVPDLNVEAAVWNADTTGNIRLHEAALREAAADASKAERSEARLRLARFLLANRFFPEAGAVLSVLARDDEIAGASKPVLMAQLMAAVLGDRSREARALLARPKLADDAEAQLWRAVLDAGERAWQAALVGFRKAMPILDSYPDGLNLLLRPLVIEAALAGGDPIFARDQIGRYESLQGVRPNLALAALQRGRAAALLGREDEALREFDAAVEGDREVEARARLERVLYQLKQNRIERPAAIAELETIGAIWRRGDVEVRSLAELGKLYAATGRWREAFGTARRAVQIMPDHPQARSLQDEMARAFAAMFIGGKDQGLSKVEALGLYYDFKNFTPPGRDGDEMIRHLADRLADLDLLDQSTELLRHQVEHRLEGAARARVAASLAVLYLRNHKPSEAVEVLRETRLNGLPRELARGRTMLEARGLSDMSLTDAALELAASQDGPEAEQLRADILWRGKRWRAAGEALEFKLHDRWRETAPLGDGERMDVLRGAVAYVLGDDAIGLDRLRSKYAMLMADSADAHTFGLIAGQAATRPSDFREVARAVVSADTLKAFLDSYHKRFPAVVPAAAQPAAEQPMPPKPAAEQAKATPPAGGKAA